MDVPPGIVIIIVPPPAVAGGNPALARAIRARKPCPLAAGKRWTITRVPRGRSMLSSTYSWLVVASRTLRSNSRAPPPSSFLACTIALFTSNNLAAVPGKGRASKVVPERNLNKIVEDIG
jgi:hypothetical protein